MSAPKITRIYATRNIHRLQELITVSTRFNVAFAFVVVSTLCLFSAQLIGLLFGREYLPAQLSLYVLSLGELLTASVGCAAVLLNMCGFEKSTMPMLFFFASANVSLNLLLVPQFGAVGAASATTLVVVVSGFFMNLKVKQSIGISAFAFTPLRNAS